MSNVEILFFSPLGQEVVQAEIGQVQQFYGLQTEEPAESSSSSPGPSTSTKTVTTWTEEQTRCMLNMYLADLDNVGPLKKFRNKRDMWESISKKLFEQLGVLFTAVQVENRFKNVSKKNKNVLKNNRTSGSTIVGTPYDSEMRQIAAVDDSIEPEVIMSPTFIRRKRPAEALPESTEDTDASDTPVTSPANKKIAKRTDIHTEILEEYRAECGRKEQRRAERAKEHREKMEKLDKLNNVLEALMNKLP